ncbi:recombinase family protein [Streptomyces galilaeus]|uniref:Recombinase family protein n=1 Tax=Streptomyces galilaeus TaxID=33899 RepID=A0ABW9IPM7_STRGJ
MSRLPAADAPATFRRRKRASLYARLSVAADNENVSLDGMVEDMRALCERENLEEVALHIDDGKSGGRRDRDEFQAWLNDARTGHAEVLVNPSTDRLTREGLNVAATILDTIEGKDPATGKESGRPVRLIDCAGIDSDHGDAFRFRFVIQAEVGRAERERIRQRSRDRHRRLKRANRWGGGSPPYGYKPVPNPDGEGWVLEVEPAEAKALRDAAEALLKDPPDSFNRVIRRMNHAGIKPRRAEKWSRIALRRALTGDHILGRLTAKGRPLRDEDGQIVAPWPPVLTVGQVTALRAKIGPGARPAAFAPGRPSRVLSGLLTCHGCGNDLIVHRRDAKLKTSRTYIPAYRCATNAETSDCPKPVSVAAEGIEKFVTDLYLITVGHMPMYTERTVVSGLEELAAVDEEIKDALSDLATNAKADTFEKLQKLQARQKELSAMDPTSRTELVPTGLTMAEHWERSMTDDRRDLLDAAFAELVVGPGRRGPKGFDPSRLTYRWVETEDDGTDEDDRLGG